MRSLRLRDKRLRSLKGERRIVQCHSTSDAEAEAEKVPGRPVSHLPGSEPHGSVTMSACAGSIGGLVKTPGAGPHPEAAGAGCSQGHMPRTPAWTGRPPPAPPPEPSAGAHTPGISGQRSSRLVRPSPARPSSRLTHAACSVPRLCFRAALPSYHEANSRPLRGTSEASPLCRPPRAAPPPATPKETEGPRRCLCSGQGPREHPETAGPLSRQNRTGPAGRSPPPQAAPPPAQRCPRGPGPLQAAHLRFPLGWRGVHSSESMETGTKSDHNVHCC